MNIKEQTCDHIYESYCPKCGIDSYDPVTCGDCLRPECKGCGR